MYLYCKILLPASCGLIHNRELVMISQHLYEIKSIAKYFYQLDIGYFSIQQAVPPPSALAASTAF